MSSRNSKISEKRGHQSPISWIENALRLLFGGFPGLDHLLGWRDMSVSLYISNVLTPRSPIAQNWRETSDETRMIYQPELSVVIGGYASFLSNQFQCCRARSFIHIHRIRWVKNKSRRFYSEVPYDLFNLHLSNDSFTSMRSAGSVKISLHIILFTHFKPIWGTYFGALLFPAEKQWHSIFRYDDVLQALDSSSVSPFFGHIWCFKPSFQEFIKKCSWMIHLATSKGSI